jgi:ADP-ribosylglycohydrolase
MNSNHFSVSDVNRRTWFKTSLTAGLGVALSRLSAGEPEVAPGAAPGAVPLREKFFGCIVACHVGSAMAAPVEGWSWDRIEKEYGTLDRLLPYQHYGNKWTREPGTTEDGVERQKLMITAILEKQDRVNAEDVRSSWVRHIKPESIGMVSERFEARLLAMAKTGMPARDIGKYCDYAGLISLARSGHPLGLINAGDPLGAIEDVREVGQLYNVANSRGIRWAEVTAVGLAAATHPKATVDSVLGAIFNHCDKPIHPGGEELGILRELERALKLTEDCQDFRQMRQKFDALYSGRGIPYAFSYANEVVTKAVCVFRMTKGVTWEAMKAGVNMGRDTDCLTAVGGGLAGALSGAASVPVALIEQVDRATKLNKYTNSQRTLRETADGLHQAYRARLKRWKDFLQEMESA